MGVLPVINSHPLVYAKTVQPANAGQAAKHFSCALIPSRTVDGETLQLGKRLKLFKNLHGYSISEQTAATMQGPAVFEFQQCMHQIGLQSSFDC